MAPLMSTTHWLKKISTSGGNTELLCDASCLHFYCIHYNLKHFVAFLVHRGSHRPVRVPLGCICKIKLLPLSPWPGDGTPPGVIAAL